MEYLITKNDVTYRCTSDILEHHGIKGQKWGVRRYQNPDGSLTPEGKKRYGNDPERYKKDLAATKARESAVAKIKSRKQEVKAESRQNRQEIKAYNSSRNKAIRAVSVVLGGPFINTLYSDFLKTASSKSVAVGETILTSLLIGTDTFGIGNYAVQRLRQTYRAAKKYDNEHPNSTAMDLQNQKKQAERDFKRK